MAVSAAQRLRSALSDFWSGEYAAQLYRLRDPDDDGPPRSRARGRWLVATEAAEVLEEVEGSGELSADECAALRRQIAFVRHTLWVLPAESDLRDALARAVVDTDTMLALPEALARLASADDERRRAASAREIDRALRPIASAYAAAHASAESPLRVVRPRGAGGQSGAETVRPSGLIIVSAFSPEAMTEDVRDLPALPWRDAALAFMKRTEDAAEDAVRYCLRKRDPGAVIAWHTLLHALRASDLDASNAAAQRWSRAVVWLRKLGFERELSARLRGDVDRSGALPAVSVLPLAVPLDVRVAQSPIDYGVISDVLAAGGAARALAVSLTHPALPAELRWPTRPSPSGAFGALSAQLWGEREHLIRLQELTDLQAQRVGRVAATFCMLSARAATALALLEIDSEQREDERLEATASALSSALRCDVPISVAGLLGSNRVAARRQAQEQLAALAWYCGLRERFDGDWFRNPRCAELFRSLCARGQALTARDSCEELGVTLDDAAARAIELVT